MRLITALMLLLLAAVVSGCQSHGYTLEPAQKENLRVIALTPLDLGTLDGISATAAGDLLTLRIKQVGANGRFLHVELGDPASVKGETWVGNAGLLHLVVATSSGLDIGLVPTRSFGGGSVECALTLAPIARQTSSPPIGQANAVQDLKVVEVAQSRVRLEWTEVHVGDYDFNGEVSVADLTPVGKYYGSQSADPDWNEAYVADGDQNGEITIADITPIGQNYGTTIAGYVVERDGAVITNPEGGTPTVLRYPDPGSSGAPRYSLELDGTIDDVWSVAPVDNNNNPGVEADPALYDRMDLRINLQISGLELFNLSGGGSGSYGPGFAILRVIDDIDLPYRDMPEAWLGLMSEGPLGDVYYNDLPRGRSLLLDFCYAPVVDLGDGSPKSVSQARGTSDLAPDQLVITSLPFSLPTGGQQMQINADISLTQVDAGDPTAGYYVDLSAALTTLNGTKNYRSRLNYKTGQVSKDNDLIADGYSDEAKLADADHDSVSDATLSRLADFQTYSSGIIEAALVRGVVSAYDETMGTLTLSEPWAYDVVFGWSPLPLMELELRFTEDSQFAGYSQGSEFDIDPAGITPPQYIEAAGYRLTYPSAGLPALYWMDKLVRKSS